MQHYIHRLQPEAIRFTDSFAIHWYGLSYLAGLLIAGLLLVYLHKKGLFALGRDQTLDFLTFLCLFGVFIGGRLGYFLFYKFDAFIANPTILVRLQDGGMASHGGIIGCILVMMWAAQKYQVSFWHLTDSVATVTAPGIFLGRLANFVNGELWGHHSEVPWAVVFPTELGSQLRPEYRYDLATLQSLVDQGVLAPRHPSQLYEALAEGLILFIVLFSLRLHPWSRAKEGRLSIVFLLGYAVARISCEMFRVPDSTTYFGGLITKGQLLTFFMVATALAVLPIKRNPMQEIPSDS